jgi:hypothetical protein
MDPQSAATNRSAVVDPEEMQRFVANHIQEGNARRSSTVSTVNYSTATTQAVPVARLGNDLNLSAPSADIGDNQGITATCSHLIPILCFKEGQIGVISVQASFAFTAAT